MGTRTEVNFHVRMSRRLVDGLRAMAAEREMALAEFIRVELRKTLDEHRNGAKAQERSIANAEQSIPGTGPVPDRAPRR